MSSRRLILIDHPYLVFNALTFVTAVLATSSPSLIPAVLHLSALLVYTPLLVNRPSANKQAAFLWINLSFAKFVIFFAPAIHALSSPAPSLALLFLGGLITSAITLATLYIHTKLRSRLLSAWSQIMLFPALWAAVWWGVSSVSPIGRLTSWTPVVDTMGYSWMLKWLGPVMDDWITAAWAVVISEIAGAWLMSSESLEEEEPLLGNRGPGSKNETTAAASMPSWRCILYLSTLLAVSTIPSFIVSDIVLFGYHSVQQTKKLDGQAQVLLWPEGAVTFRDESQRAAALAEVQKTIRGSLVGVSFEESVKDPSDATGRSLLRRNGMVVVSNKSSSPHLEYYKRHLVPVAESFSLVHSTTPATIYTMEMKNPSDVKKPDWAPPPKFTRPVPMTASICLDFAIPGTLAALGTRPALILAPARTWEPTVGLAMWEQAKRRAAELDSTILWCDGGDGGVSGVSGKGITEVTQVGEGSWVRSYPFNEERTVYGIRGNSIAMVFIGIIFAGGFARAIPWPTLGNLHIGWVKEKYARFRAMLGRNETPDLVDFYRRSRLFCTSPNFKNKSKDTTASLNSVRSRFARRPRGSLRLLPHNSHIQPAVGINDEEDDDASSGFFVVTAADLPISLDSPQQLTLTWNSDKPTNLSPTPCSTSPPSVVNDVSVLNRFRNHSRVSIFPRRRLRLPLPKNKGNHTSDPILDDFPDPPTHIPTPTDATSAVNFAPHSVSYLVSVDTETSKKRRIFSTESLKSLTKRVKWRRRQADLSPLHELPISIEKPLPPTPTEEYTTVPPVITYCVVDPVELTASPSPHIGLDLCAPSARTSFLPPSPSWLSRNLPAPYRVPSYDSTVPEASTVPASPPPLPIPPRLAEPSLQGDSPPLSPLEVTSWLTHLETFKFSKNNSASSLIQYRSLSRRSSVKSISTQSFFTYSASGKENQVHSSKDHSSLLLKPSGSPPSLPHESPASAKPGSSPTLCSVSIRTHIHPLLSPQPSLKHPVLSEDRQIFIPTAHPDTDINDPSDFLTTAFESVFSEARGHLLNMDLYGKTGEVIDFGGEVDYSGAAWFQDVPQRPTPAPQSVGTPYVPDPDVITQNEAFEYALTAAPNLGVLAWCSEFGELIDNLKEMGFAGNMFVSTRSQALKTCDEILRLRLTDVKMQIIVMYLSSQVSRLRRFLDGDRVWDDYPELTFPLEPMKHQATS
ncbi:uncharacterized protein BT62DRAFT_1000131 [Guyanagaster necrorhizus]|uniref:CN hydrolase domain-containing protein n=1 Tax=Guyanagaster necrorhizus TaxID=856835 RepID=A0A9P7W6Y5_9AGAR|nr:uncharacterized protein BT62DRAFT_1000131 [Guyanagaster necrorhizus MCA 3950]KAG7452396.1 hypothetical protein BT62DRAFT_1000131 [Guyanagaster necrorhizus MCA 3950]